MTDASLQWSGVTPREALTWERVVAAVAVVGTVACAGAPMRSAVGPADISFASPAVFSGSGELIAAATNRGIVLWDGIGEARWLGDCAIATTIEWAATEPPLLLTGNVACDVNAGVTADLFSTPATRRYPGVSLNGAVFVRTDAESWIWSDQRSVGIDADDVIGIFAVSPDRRTVALRTRAATGREDVVALYSLDHGSRTVDLVLPGDNLAIHDGAWTVGGLVLRGSDTLWIVPTAQFANAVPDVRQLNGQPGIRAAFGRDPNVLLLVDASSFWTVDVRSWEETRRWGLSSDDAPREIIVANDGTLAVRYDERVAWFDPAVGPVGETPFRADRCAVDTLDARRVACCVALADGADSLVVRSAPTPPTVELARLEHPIPSGTCAALVGVSLRGEDALLTGDRRLLRSRLSERVSYLVSVSPARDSVGALHGSERLSATSWSP